MSIKTLKSEEAIVLDLDPRLGGVLGNPYEGYREVL